MPDVIRKKELTQIGFKKSVTTSALVRVL